MVQQRRFAGHTTPGVRMICYTQMVSCKWVMLVCRPGQRVLIDAQGDMIVRCVAPLWAAHAWNGATRRSTLSWLQLNISAVSHCKFSCKGSLNIAGFLFGAAAHTACMSSLGPSGAILRLCKDSMLITTTLCAGPLLWTCASEL